MIIELDILQCKASHMAREQSLRRQSSPEQARLGVETVHPGRNDISLFLQTPAHLQQISVPEGEAPDGVPGKTADDYRLVVIEPIAFEAADIYVLDRADRTPRRPAQPIAEPEKDRRVVNIAPSEVGNAN